MKLKSLMNKVDVYEKLFSIVCVALKKLRLRHSRFRAKSFCLFNKTIDFGTRLVYLFNKSLSLIGKSLMFKKVLIGLACCGILLFVSLFGFGYVVDNDGTENAGDSFWRGSPLPNARMQINVMTGNMWLKQMDYQTTGGLGGPLDLKRFYNTVIQTDGLFGKGWRTQFDVSLVAYGDSLLASEHARRESSIFRKNRHDISLYIVTAEAFYCFSY